MMFTLLIKWSDKTIPRARKGNRQTKGKRETEG